VTLVDDSADERCLHEDARAGVVVEASVLAPDRWKKLLAPGFVTSVEPISEVEQLVLALKPMAMQGSPA
jgi:hypothetical protein